MFIFLLKRPGVPLRPPPAPRPPPTPPPPPTGVIDTEFGRVPDAVAGAIMTYWPRSAWRDAARVAYIESRWNPNAINDSRWRAGGRCNVRYSLPDGRTALTELSVGLFQINLCARGGTTSEFQDIATNVRTAAALFAARGWQPWLFTAERLGLPL